jgi:TolB protein
MYLEPRRSRAPLIGAVGLVLGLLIAGIMMAPRVSQVSPRPDSTQVSSLASLRIQFSRAMDAESVIEHVTIDPPIAGEFEWQGNALIFTPDRPWPQGRQVRVELAGGARSAQFLPLLFGERWSFQIGAARIVYLWPSAGPADLYAQFVSGEDRERLTETALGIRQYALSADGTRLVYSTPREDGGTDLRLLDLASGEDELILACAGDVRCDAPALAPGGNRVAYERFELQAGTAGQQVSGPSHVWSLPLDDEGDPLPIGPEDHVTTAPDWSPTGWLTYYDNTLGAIALVDPFSLPQPEPHSFVPNELGNVTTWSPDGELLVMPEIVLLPEVEGTAGPGGEASDEHEVDFYSHIKRVHVESGLTEILSGETPGLVEDASPAYSPDGRWIAFARKYLDDARWTLGRQLWLMRADGSDARQLTEDPNFNYSALTWKADSSALAGMRFNQADMSQPPEIWWMDLEEGELHVIITGGYIPRWIP